MIRPTRIVRFTCIVRPACIIRSAGIGLLLALGLACGGATRAQGVSTAGPLAEPGNYSFEPQAAAPGGVASVTYGSRNLSAASIQMESGLIGNTGTRAFIALGAVHAPDLWHGPDGSRIGVTARSTAIGLEKVFTDGTTVSIGGSWDRAQLGRSRQAAYDPAPPP